MHWLQHFLGTDSGAGTAYLWWSGAGSDLGELAIIGGLLTVARRHNCEVHGCWRLGRHAVEGTGHRVCRRHNPEGTVTAAHVRERYRLYIGSRPGKG
jgi:hypothetical protein